MERTISSYKPSVSKSGLLIIASIVWFIAGVLLNQRGLIYILEFSHHILFHAGLGLAASILLFLVIFYNLSSKYAKRILSLKSKKSGIFILKYLRGFFVLAILIFLGLCLRRYGLADRLWLSIFYIAIGFSLIFGSFNLFISFIKSRKFTQSESGNNE